MFQILFACGSLRGQLRGFGYFFLLLAMGFFASCHPSPSKKHQTVQAAQLSREDSLLGQQFPLPETFLVQKELLYKLSKPSKGVIVPDGVELAGNFGSGSIELIFEEIDGEPFNFYGHLEEPHPQEQMMFLVERHIPNELLDKLVPGQKYRIHWIETVASMVPFDEDRYRYFVVYRIEER
ncbi:MAG: hypothetical protein IPN95_03760 [Bacteroidetes bacterium]|nr:hypothetical protein [Bacteroidota bacterium]